MNFKNELEDIRKEIDQAKEEKIRLEEQLKNIDNQIEEIKKELEENNINEDNLEDTVMELEQDLQDLVTKYKAEIKD